MKIKLTHELTAKTSIKKRKEYEMDFPEDVIEKGRKATYQEPFIWKDKINIFELYLNDKGKLTIVMRHSFDSFVEA